MEGIWGLEYGECLSADAKVLCRRMFRERQSNLKIFTVFECESWVVAAKFIGYTGDAPTSVNFPTISSQESLATMIVVGRVKG